MFESTSVKSLVILSRAPEKEKAMEDNSNKAALQEM